MEEKKDKIRTFGDALLEIWKTCTQLMSSSKRIDFVFDLYLEDSIKSLERQRRSMSLEGTRTVITHIDQELPDSKQVGKEVSEFDKFWAVIENKIGLQKFLSTGSRSRTREISLAILVVATNFIGIRV